MVTSFSVPVQADSGAHPASYTLGTGSFSWGVKRPGRGVNHPPPSNADVKEIVELYLFPPWTFMSCSREQHTTVRPNARPKRDTPHLSLMETGSSHSMQYYHNYVALQGWPASVLYVLKLPELQIFVQSFQSEGCVRNFKHALFSETHSVAIANVLTWTWWWKKGLHLKRTWRDCQSENVLVRNTSNSLNIC